MARRRTVDWVAWHLYRRAWVVCACAFVLVLATGFRPQAAPESPLPPSFGRAEATAIVDRAHLFNKDFPDRRPGTSGAVEAAHWVQDRFGELGLKARIVPQTTVSPVSHEPISLSNVEASLAGRTGETIVVYAHRDTQSAAGSAVDAVDTIALLEFARDAIATRDRRRSYVFVSTDGAGAGASGAHALAERLRARGQTTVAVIGLDRIAHGTAPVHVPWTASGRWAQPIGLTRLAEESVAAEGGSSDGPSILGQFIRLATPVTLYEQGRLVEEGLPSVMITSAPERRSAPPRHPDLDSVTSSVRAAQRTVSALDAVDTLQSAGKTYVVGERRAFRGWAIKIFLATLLLPFGIVTVDLLARQLRRGRTSRAVGSVVRCALAGMWVVASLWLLASIGVLPAAGDRPPVSAIDMPNPVALGVWLALCVGGWLLMRGPDWRYQVMGDDPAMDRSRTTLAVSLVAMGLLAVLTLAINPYAVVFVAVPLHVWLLLASRRTATKSACWSVWAAGLLGPLLAFMAVTARFDIARRESVWYWVQLVQSGTIPAPMGLLIGAGAGLSLLICVTALGWLERPAIARAREGYEAVLGLIQTLPSLRSAERRHENA
jgi:hypothetical protein